MKKYLLITSILFLFAAIYSCKREAQIPVTDVCFDTQIEPIFVNNCATSGCHDLESKKGDYFLGNYENIMKGVVASKHKESAIYNAIKDQKGPHSKVAYADINAIKIWIENGAFNKKCLPPPTPPVAICDTNKFTYSEIIKPILQESCYSCHNTENHIANGGEIDLENFESLSNFTADITSTSGVYAVVAHIPFANQMPKGGAKIEECKIIQIKKWIQVGALNN
jgi:hypothetical protein